MQPRALYGSALVVMAVLVVIAGQQPPKVPVAEAERFEGQNVQMEGLVTETRNDVTGGGRFTLVRGEAAIAVKVTDEVPPAGAWVSAEGRILRSGGRLTMFADHVAASSAPEPEEPGWIDVAADPAAWNGRLIRMAGAIDAGAWGAEGRSVALGEGAWPDAGKVVATGSVAYDARCLCFLFHAIEVAPWIP